MKRKISGYGKKHKRGLKRFCAGGLAAIVLMTSVIWAGTADFANANDDPEDKTETQEAIEKEYPQLLSSGTTDGSMSKEETVYVVADADGKAKETTVTEWLRNGESRDSIDDVSTLDNIENTANDKAFTQDGNKLTWAADGSDIKYKGDNSKELPVEVKVSYWLDGMPVSAEEIAGKSGHVEIRFDYDIKTKTSADGYELTTPYTMASGVLLDDEHFTNISVEGGRVIDDGSKCICLGIAFPGMKDNLGVDISSLDIPEGVRIKAYTDKFEIDGSYTVAMTGLLSDVDLSESGSIEDKVNELESALGQLGSAADKLVAGASKISSGADELDENATALKNGAKELSDGTGKVYAGAGALLEGAKALADGTAQALSGTKELSDGTGALKDGSATLAKGTGSLKAGADNLSDGTGALKSGSADLSKGTEDLRNGADSLAQGASDLGTGVQNLVDGETQVDAGLAQIDEGLQNLSSEGESGKGIIAASDQYNAGMTAYAEALQSMIDSEDDPETKAKLQGLKDQLPMPNDYTAAVKNYVGGVDQAYAGEQAVYAGEQQVYEGMKTLQSKLPALTEGISGLQQGANKLNDGAKTLADGASAADDGAKALASGASDVNDGAGNVASGAAALDEGAKKLNSGASSLNSGANQLKNGTSSLTSGAGELDEGADALAEGTGEFKKGTSKLSAGASELYNGMNAFNSQGIQKLISGLDDAGIETLFNRLKALVDASSEITLVGGIADGMHGESKIIIKTEAVKAR